LRRNHLDAVLLSMGLEGGRKIGGQLVKPTMHSK
jgi:hypothetical protein